ncbi:MAG: hypothetical protein ACKV2U_25320 [Bryobacteraceae bacterium]
MFVLLGDGVAEVLCAGTAPGLITGIDTRRGAAHIKAKILDPASSNSPPKPANPSRTSA